MGWMIEMVGRRRGGVIDATRVLWVLSAVPERDVAGRCASRVNARHVHSRRYLAEQCDDRDELARSNSSHGPSLSRP